MQDHPAGRFVFTATGPAYFRIWIVNLMLSVATLGIYSPWAKVRRLRYFYGHTLFDDSPFEFHGRPIALLKGRLIGVVLLVAYTQAAKFSLALWLAVVAALIVLFPWLLWKSLRFRLANSSYRGIRFGFDGTVRDAYLTFVPVMLLVLAPTFVLLASQRILGTAKPSARPFAAYFAAIALVLVAAPWFYFRLRAYQQRNARLGTAALAFTGRARTVYAIAGKTLLIGLLLIVAGALAGGLAGGLVWIVARHGGVRAAPTIAGMVGGAAGYLVVLSAIAPGRAMVQNFVWNRSSLAGEPFASVVGRTKLWRIEITNLALTVATLGLFWPFAVVRSMRYRIGSLQWSGDSDGLLMSGDVVQVGAAGEESAELFGLDLSL